MVFLRKSKAQHEQEGARDQLAAGLCMYPSESCFLVLILGIQDGRSISRGNAWMCSPTQNRRLFATLRLHYRLELPRVPKPERPLRWQIRLGDQLQLELPRVPKPEWQPRLGDPLVLKQHTATQHDPATSTRHDTTPPTASTPHDPADRINTTRPRRQHQHDTTPPTASTRHDLHQHDTTPPTALTQHDPADRINSTRPRRPQQHDTAPPAKFAINLGPKSLEKKVP